MSGLAVLSFGFTRSLWDGPGAEDVQRMSAYAAQLESYTVVVDTCRSHPRRPLRLAPNFNALPTNAFTRADSFLRMLCIGWRALRSRRYDVVQGQDPLFTGVVALVLGKLFRRRVVVCVFGPNAYDRHWLASSRRNRLLAPVGRRVLRQCDCIQVDGALTARSLVAAGLPQEKIALKPVVPTNLERFLSIERPARMSAKVRLLCVSRLNSQKNLPLLLETVKALRGLTSVPFEVVIVGDGPEEAKLRTHIQREGLDELVTFHPSVSRAEIPSEYANADIFVLTSDYEGYPRVLMEAAAAALPIVTTAISGSDEAVLDGESGFIVPVRARDAIVEKLALLMEDSARRLEMGLRGRRHIAEQLDPALNAPRQLAIWRKTAFARAEDKQRLLVFNLATDAADPILAFTTQWIRELAARVGAIEVITMRAGVIDVPPNVRVHSVGKELGYSEPRRVLEFYRHLFRILRAGPVAGCFSHMMPEFSTLAGPVLRARGIPLVTWYAHPSLTWFVRAAHLFSNRIVTSLPNAYPGRRDKLSVIGQGIDTELFQPNDSTPVEEDLILCVGRISRVKGHLTLLRAFAQQDRRLRLVILGTTAGAEDEAYARELRQLVSELGLTERVTFAPALSRAELPAQYRRCAVHVNLTPAGFGDKVAWEAMSCGRPCLVANEDFRETLGEHVDALLFRTGDVSDLADKLRALLEKTPEERAAVGAALRRQVERLHSLPRLADRVLHELRGTAPAPLANPEPELA